MESQNACVNSHEPTISANPFAWSMAELDCSFTKVTKNGKTALLACIDVQVQTHATETLSALLHHAEELNIRLPFLRVSVRGNAEEACTIRDTASTHDTQENYVFVLRGMSHRSITNRNISTFLNRLTNDFKIFLAYAKAHNIRVLPNVESSAVKPCA